MICYHRTNGSFLRHPEVQLCPSGPLLLANGKVLK
jgi:hypothetical protein